MKLNELIDAAIEAHARHGDIDIVFISQDDAGLGLSFLDIIVAQIRVDGGSQRVVFAFVPALDDESLAVDGSVMQ